MQNDYDLEQELVECPYCAEKVLAKAKKCKHCGEILDVQMREIDMLKKQINNPSLILNNNNNNANPVHIMQVKRNYPWFWHLILTLLTGGGWIIIWIICYLLRDKNIYN